MKAQAPRVLRFGFVAMLSSGLVACSMTGEGGEESAPEPFEGSLVGVLEGAEEVVTSDDEVPAPSAEGDAQDPIEARLAAYRERLAEARRRAQERREAAMGRQSPSAPACEEVELPSCADQLIILDSTTDMTLSESPIGNGDDIDPTKNVERMKRELLERLPDYTSIVSEEFDRRARESWTRTFDRKLERVAGSEDLVLVMRACEAGIYRVWAKGNNIPARYHWRVSSAELGRICGAEVERVSGTWGGGSNRSGHGMGLKKGETVVFVLESDATEPDASVDLEIRYEGTEWKN